MSDAAYLMKMVERIENKLEKLLEAVQENHAATVGLRDGLDKVRTVVENYVPYEGPDEDDEDEDEEDEGMRDLIDAVKAKVLAELG